MRRWLLLFASAALLLIAWLTAQCPLVFSRDQLPSDPHPRYWQNPRLVDQLTVLTLALLLAPRAALPAADTQNPKKQPQHRRHSRR